MAKKNELTVSQAGDLARYFLGPAWRAAIVGHGSHELRDIASFSDGQYERRFIGDGWRAVFRAAGIRLPSRSRYTQHGTSVMLEGEHIASCVSGTKASLICAALNSYESTPAVLP